jgi:DNA polymerase-3 subunit delta'
MSEPFPDIVGHGLAKAFLARAVRGNPSHSYLFLGPEGVGKFLLAQRFAQALACPEALAKVCACPSCRHVLAGSHPDVRVLSLGEESIKMEDVRRLREASAMSPVQAPYLVNLVDQADRLTPEACASLLKLLEEPPPRVVNVLVTARPEALPPTIRSRCLEIPFSYLPREELERQLTGHGIAQVAVLARFAGGRMGEALRWGNEETWDRRQRYLEIAWEIASDNPSFAQSDRILKEKDKRMAIDFLRTLYSAWRDLAIWSVQPEAVINQDQLPHLSQLAPRRDASAWARGCRSIEEVLELSTSPVNMGMLLPVLLFKLGGGRWTERDRR